MMSGICVPQEIDAPPRDSHAAGPWALSMGEPRVFLNKYRRYRKQH